MQLVVKRVLWVAVIISGAVSTVMLFVGSQMTGISWDEIAHVDDLFGPQRAGDVNELHFGIYGLSFQLMGHAAAVLIAGEPIGDTLYQSGALLARHFVSASLALLAAAATGILVFLVSSSRLLGAWALAALLAVPVFLGHGMFNPKDIPVATGYTLVTLGCVSWLKSINSSKWSIPQVSLQLLAIGSGFWLAVGSRYIFLPIIGLTLVLTLIAGFLLLARHHALKRSVAIRGLIPIAGGLFGFLLLYATNPCLIMQSDSPGCSFPTLLTRTFDGSVGIAEGQPLLLFGSILSQDSKPFGALAVYVLAGTPILLLVMALYGALIFLLPRIQSVTKSSSITKLSAVSPSFLVVAPVFAQLLLLPLISIIANTSVYDAQRQHLYIFPAVVFFAAIGVNKLITANNGPTSRFSARQALGVLLAVGAITIPVVEGLRLFPYNYVYVNPVASANGYLDKWETDYWATSFREAIKKIPSNVEFYVVGPPGSVYSFLSEQGSESRIRTIDIESDEAVGIQLHRTTFGLGRPMDGCRVLDTVERRLRGDVLPMSYVLACDKEVLSKYQRLPS